MKKFLDNNVTALITIVILAVGSISGVGMAQFVIGSDGSLLSNILGGCIYGACKDTKITGNVTDGILAGCIYGACKNTEITGHGQPSPNIGTLIVTKIVECHNDPSCDFQASDFNIKITGNNPSPESFKGSESGTEVTLGPGDYQVIETVPFGGAWDVSVQGDCEIVPGEVLKITGNMKAGETQEYTITNSFQI